MLAGSVPVGEVLGDQVTVPLMPAGEPPSQQGKYGKDRCQAQDHTKEFADIFHNGLLRFFLYYTTQKTQFQWVK